MHIKSAEQLKNLSCACIHWARTSQSHLASLLHLLDRIQVYWTNQKALRLVGKQDMYAIGMYVSRLQAILMMKDMLRRDLVP